MTGQAIKELPRDELVIATKVFGRMGAYGSGEQTPEAQRRYDNANLWGLSRKHIFDAIDASLKRLDLDYIDLYQVHSFDPVTPLEETLEALDEVVKAGKARYIGLCNYAAWQIAKAMGVSARKRSPAMNRCRCTIRSRGAILNAKSCRWRKIRARDPAVEPARGRLSLRQVHARQPRRPKARAAWRSTSRRSIKRRPTTSSM